MQEELAAIKLRMQIICNIDYGSKLLLHPDLLESQMLERTVRIRSMSQIGKADLSSNSFFCSLQIAGAIGNRSTTEFPGSYIPSL